MNKKYITIIIAVLVVVYASSLLFKDSALAPDAQDAKKLDVATTTPVTTTPPKPAVKKTTTSPAVPKVSAYTISYTDSGFNPGVIEVKLGSTITFVNNSSKELSVASTAIGGFGVTLLNQKGSINRGGTFSVTFTGTGTWSYMNRLNQRDGGNIIVK
jgi:plastocyanin